MNAYDICRKLSFGTGIDFKKFASIPMNSYHRENGDQKDAAHGQKEHNFSKSSDNVKSFSTDDSHGQKRKKQSSLSEDEETNFFGEQSTKKKKKKKKLSKERLAQIKREEVTHFRRVHQIHVEGSDIPYPIENFSQLEADYGLNPAISDNLKELGYSSPTPVQMQVIPVMLHERQVLVSAPTGSGKTAAFLIPVIQKLQAPKKKGPRALVLAPTKELALQLYHDCVRLSKGTGLRPYVVSEKAEKIKQQLGKSSKKRHDILISTPQRLIHILKDDEPIISLSKVEWLLIDESDKLFEHGKQGFREQLAEIYKACDSAFVKRAMFSATYSHDVEEWCKLNFDGLITVSIGDRNTAVDTVEQKLVFTGDDSGKLFHFRDLIRNGFTPPVLIFVESKEQAKKLYKELVFDDIHLDVIHADRTQEEREKVIRDFRLGKIWVLISTDVLGRGIDLKRVNLVINYDLPPDTISYIHRIGRTGRAGRKGHAITYFNHEDFPKLEKIFRGRLRKLLGPLKGEASVSS